MIDSVSITGILDQRYYPSSYEEIDTKKAQSIQLPLYKIQVSNNYKEIRIDNSTESYTPRLFSKKELSGYNTSFGLFPMWDTSGIIGGTSKIITRENYYGTDELYNEEKEKLAAYTQNSNATYLLTIHAYVEGYEFSGRTYEVATADALVLIEWENESSPTFVIAPDISNFGEELDTLSITGILDQRYYPTSYDEIDTKRQQSISLPLYKVQVGDNYKEIRIDNSAESYTPRLFSKKELSGYNASFGLFPMWDTSGIIGGTSKIITRENYYGTDELYNEEKEKLIAYTLDDNATYLLTIHAYVEGYEFSGRTYEVATADALVLFEWKNDTSGSSVDKSALEAEIDKVTRENASQYYQSGDRFNGKAADTITTKNSGFWLVLTAENGPLENAQTVYGDTKATQDQVDAAAEALSDAVARLIPREQLNATKLYETITQYENNYYETDAERPWVNGFQQGVLLSDYTEPTANAYRTALQNAKAYLASLFDSTGAANEEVNIAANQSVADSYADALTAAVRGLLSKEDVGMFEVYRGTISSLNNLFSEAENGGRYEETSWTAFTAARDAANDYAAAHPVTANSTGTELTQYRTLAENYWYACYGLTPSGSAAVSLRFADNGGAKYPDSAVDSTLATYSNTVTLTQSTGYTLEALLRQADLADDLTVEGAYTYLVYVNGVLLRAPFYYESDYQYSVYLFEEGGKADWNDVCLRNGDEVVIVRALKPTYTVYISQEYVGFGYVKDNFGTLRYRSAEEISVKAGEEFSFNVSGAAGYLPDYDGRYSQATNTELIVYGPMQADGSYPLTCSGAITNGGGTATLALLEAGTYYVTAVDTRDLKEAPDYFYPNLMAGCAPVKVTVTGLTGSELAEARAEYLAELDAAYEGYVEGYYIAENWATLTGYYTAARETINGTDSLQEMRTAIDDAKENMAAVEAIDHAGVLAQFAHYLKYLPSIEQIGEGCFTQADRERMGWINELYASMTDFQKDMLSPVQKAQYEALLAAYGEDGSGLSAFTPFTVTVAVDENAVVYDSTSSQLWDYYYDRSGSLNQINGVGFNSNTLEGGSGPFIVVGNGSHKSDVILLTVNIAKDHYSHFDGIEADGVETDNTVVEEYQYYYRYYYYILNPYHDFTIRIKSVADSLQKTKNEALTALETVFNGYKKSDYTAENWATLTAAYSAGVAAINDATNADGIEDAKQTAIDAMAVVPKKTGSSLGTVTVIVENTTFPEVEFPEFSGTIIGATPVTLEESSSMMKAALTALHNAGYSWSGTGGKGYEITYLSYIYTDTNGNGKYDRGEPMLGELSGTAESGWMGTLNDWFVNESFASFTVASGKLEDGDVIRIQFTNAGLGTDLGATWANNDTSLLDLGVTSGSIAPAFDPGTTEYILSPSGSSVALQATAANKNFQVRIFLNQQNKNADADYYRSGESIPVKSGDVIWIGIGEPAWPTMNQNTITPTWYKLTVVSGGDSSAVVNLINDIGSVTFANYKSRASAISQARAAYDALNDAAQAKVTNYQTLLNAETALTSYKQVGAVQDEIAALPKNITEANREAVETAYEHYNALSPTQMDLLSNMETNKLLKAVNTLTLPEELAKIPATKDFTSEEANDLQAALLDWLGGLGLTASFSVDVDVLNEAVPSENRDGSYSATVTLTLGSDNTAASKTKTVNGTITLSEQPKSHDAGVKSIKVNGIRATGSGTSYAATLPIGSDVAAATFEIEPADKANVTDGPTASDGGTLWSFTVTAEDGETSETYTVTLTVSKMEVNVLECAVYSVTDDVTVVELSPAVVTGLREAVKVEELGLPETAQSVSLWLKVTAESKAGSEITVKLEPMFAVDGGEEQQVPADALIGSFTVTLPISCTANAKVRYGTTNVNATGSDSGITFTAPGIGSYTIIPDAQIAEVPEEQIDISKTNGTPIATVTSEIDASGTATLHVTAEKACVVVVKIGDTYQRLEATANGSGGYDFSQSGYNSNMEFHVLLKGDADSNGDVTITDAMLLAKACLSETQSDYWEASDLIRAAFGTIDLTQAMRIVKSCLSSTHDYYLPLTW